MPAEGLEKNETSVRVLDEDATEEERRDRMDERVRLLQQDTSVDQLYDRQKLTERVKSDPGYKFLMMVAAFTSQKLKSIMSAEPVKRVTENVVCIDDDPGEDWLEVPEVSGVVHLSTEVYGHIKEAEMILQNGFLCTSLKSLVENPLYAQLFARLVSIRINLSDSMASKKGAFNKTFDRLHQEQSMVLKALRQRGGSVRQHDWTRPYYSQ